MRISRTTPPNHHHQRNGKVSRCVKAFVLLDLVVSLVCMMLYRTGHMNVFASMHPQHPFHLRGGTDDTTTAVQTVTEDDHGKAAIGSSLLHQGMRLQYAMPQQDMIAQPQEERRDEDDEEIMVVWYDAVVSKEPIQDPKGAYSLVHLVLLKPVEQDILYGGVPWKKQAYVARYYGPSDGRWRLSSLSGDYYVDKTFGVCA